MTKYTLEGDQIRQRTAEGIFYRVTDEVEASGFVHAFEKFYEKWDLCYPCKVTDENGDSMTNGAWFEILRLRRKLPTTPAEGVTQD